MIEILPNWHPVLVHFTIALLTMAVIFYVLKLILPSHSKHQAALNILAKTNLYVGVAFAIATAIAGWFAYNSVNHDTPSHLAMTEHRNIALITLGVFVLLALWSFFFKNKANIIFVIAMLIAGGLLSATGWMGAEAVYRYGLGVMSLPKSTGEGHAHKHPDGQGHGDQMMTNKKSAEDMPHEHAEGQGHGDQSTTNKKSTENMPHEHAEGDKHGVPINSSEIKQNDHDKTPHDHAEEQTNTNKATSHDQTPHTH